MAKKKKNGKKANFIFIIGLIAVIAVLILGYYGYQKQEKDINDANKIIYDSLLCISNCPVSVLFGTNPLQAVFDEKCINNCMAGTGHIGEKLSIDKIKTNDERILLNSPEFNACKQNLNSDNNADKYQACLKQILPGLKDRFNIN